MTEALVLVSLAGVLACGACGESAGPARTAVAVGPTTAVAVDVSTPGRAVPDDFLGVSVEWNSVREYLGDGTGHARAAAVTLFAAFAAEGHRPEVRIGGNSEDQAWWNPSGLPRPAGVLHDLDTMDLNTLADLQHQVGNQFVLGLNLVLDDADNAAALVTAVRTAIPHGLFAFELGNEPDVFVSDGHRPAGYDWAAYQADVRQFRDGINAQLATPVPFQWPAVARRTWLDALAAAIPDQGDQLASVSTHVYPYTVCLGFPAPRPQALLTPFATAQVAAAYAPVARAAHNAGIPYRMGELNSVSCGGAAGVSDVYASALWAADVSTERRAAGPPALLRSPPGLPRNRGAWTSRARHGHPTRGDAGRDRCLRHAR